MEAFLFEISHFIITPAISKLIISLCFWFKRFIVARRFIRYAMRAHPRRAEVVAIANPQKVGNLFGRPKARASRRRHV